MQPIDDGNTNAGLSILQRMAADLLARYATNQVTETERHAVEAHLQTDDQDRESIALAQEQLEEIRCVAAEAKYRGPKQEWYEPLSLCGVAEALEQSRLERGKSVRVAHYVDGSVEFGIECMNGVAYLHHTTNDPDAWPRFVLSGLFTANTEGVACLAEGVEAESRQARSRQPGLRIVCNTEVVEEEPDAENRGLVWVPIAVLGTLSDNPEATVRYGFRLPLALRGPLTDATYLVVSHPTSVANEWPFYIGGPEWDHSMSTQSLAASRALASRSGGTFGSPIELLRFVEEGIEVVLSEAGEQKLLLEARCTRMATVGRSCLLHLGVNDKTSFLWQAAHTFRQVGERIHHWISLPNGSVPQDKQEAILLNTTLDPPQTETETKP